jgi:uncharacterized membrane protein
MTQESTTKPIARNFNKPVYILFTLAGLCFLAVKDFSQASIFWGLALAFDPFNIEIPFSKRPFYQRAWLFVHLAIALSLFVAMLLIK